MNDDDAAWHQLELEQQRREEEQRLLQSDPSYIRWLQELEKLHGYDEICRQRVEIPESR